MQSTLQILDATVRSMVSLAVIGIGMNAQAFLTVIPSPFLALCGGFIAFTWIFPTFWTCFGFGIFGTPTSWKSILQSLRKQNTATQNRNSSNYSAVTTLWQALMFRPFHCPKKLRTRLPQWFIPLLFREKPVMIPPIINSSTTSSVRNEYWILVNGIGTNQHMAQQSQEILQRLFGRPCWLYYIPTNSLWFDLLYKFVEDRVGWTTPQQPLLFQALHNAIVQAAAGRYERVVLITHASGVRTTLQELHDMDPHFSHLLQRFLEVYTLGGPTVPHVGAYLEHLIRWRGDSVAWLGVLFPYPRFWRNVHGTTISVNGRLCKEPEQWGHLLQAHYLEPMIEKGAFRSSRLNAFRNGQAGTRVFQLNSS